MKLGLFHEKKHQSDAATLASYEAKFTVFVCFKF